MHKRNLPSRGRTQTVFAGRGKPGTVFAGRRSQMNTIYAGGKRIDTIYAGGKRIDTIYAGGKRRRMNTVFGGLRDRSGGLAGCAVMKVVDPNTRQVQVVVYNATNRNYFDQSSRTWKPAPAWMISQVD